MIQTTAPGKIILFGEHAVVYGRPAIAIPVSEVCATATIEVSDSQTFLIAPDLSMEMAMAEAEADNPIAVAIRIVETSIKELPPMRVTVTSSIPIASGLGSGAAISAAIIRGVTQFMDWPVSNKFVSELAFEVEKIHHGTPSGIDNTVVAYESPIYFIHYETYNEIKRFKAKRPLTFVIADTGIKSPTKVAVGDVRKEWEANPEMFNALFDRCGQVAEAGRAAIQAGRINEVGRLMSENHILLQTMTVSSPELDNLVNIAVQAGALGAKLSGAGRGGNIIALVEDGEKATAVSEALRQAGAKSIFVTTLEK